MHSTQDPVASDIAGSLFAHHQGNYLTYQVQLPIARSPDLPASELDHFLLVTMDPVPHESGSWLTETYRGSAAVPYQLLNELVVENAGTTILDDAQYEFVLREALSAAGYTL